MKTPRVRGKNYLKPILVSCFFAGKLKVSLLGKRNSHRSGGCKSSCAVSTAGSVARLVEDGVCNKI